jgi:hypothetical protein
VATPTFATVDASAAVKAWLAALPITGIRRRVFYATPEDAKAPWVTFSRIGGGPVADDVPVEVPVYTIRLTGRTFPNAWEMASALVAAVRSMPNGVISAGVRFGGARVLDGPREIHDDDAHLATLSIDVQFTVLPTG